MIDLHCHHILPGVDDGALARRLRWLPVATVRGRQVRVASGRRARLLGLAHLDRERAGPGLLIPRCSSVHTFGMRFPLDLVFLDERGEPISTRRGVPPRRLAWERRAAAVLELPARGEEGVKLDQPDSRTFGRSGAPGDRQGGEFSPPVP